MHKILGSKHDLDEFFNNEQIIAKMGIRNIASQLKKEQRSLSTQQGIMRIIDRNRKSTIQVK